MSVQKSSTIVLVFSTILLTSCGLFTPKPQPTIAEMEAAVDQAVKAQLAPVITAQGDADVKLTTIQNTVSKVQQGQNALDQKVGTIGTQTIVSTDPKVVAEIRQVGVDTVKAVSESVERTGANRLKVEAAIVVAMLGIGFVLLFTQAPTNGLTSLIGKIVGGVIFVAACAALLTMIL